MVLGHEQFVGMDATVLEFWRWAMGDLKVNTTRSMLAEFLVAKAVGGEARNRVEWDNYDVLSPEGIRIEVKAFGYRQSWGQKKQSVPQFGGFRGREWDRETGVYSDEPRIRADVFVFAVQTCQVDAEYDALDVGQWQFYTLPASIIEAHAGKSVGLGFVKSHSKEHGRGPVPWAQLRDAVLAVYSPTQPAVPRGEMSLANRITPGS
jgi:hypothetical protein